MIQVGNAPCSWGIIENIDGKTWEYDQVLDEMAATGYAGTELGDWGFMPTEPEQLGAELAARDLALIASWVSVSLSDPSQHAQSIADAVRTARLLAEVAGSEAFVVLGDDPYVHPVRTKHAGRIEPEHELSEEQWQVFSAGATRIAEAVRRETGLRTVMHHHIGTWIETPKETDRFLQMTDPELVGLCFDTGHWCFGGGDPVGAIRRYANRIWHVHFKDFDPEVAKQSRSEGWDAPTSVGQGVFCELGRGAIDFRAVLAGLRDIGYDGWIVVEQDVLPGMGTPKESAQRNRDYLHSIGI